MRELATIREIKAICPIKGADKIEVATVDGWEVVVAKADGFKVGDLVVYVEIDSQMPQKPEFEFLKSRKYRVRTIKLRGQISQGLILPLDVLGKKKVKLGDDVTGLLGIIKYDPEWAKEQKLLATSRKSPLFLFLMKFKWFRTIKNKLFPKVRGDFPEWIRKTDETRIQNLTKMFEQERDLGTTFSVTEKLDGQSATYFVKKQRNGKYEFGVCSRNLRLFKPDNSSYWAIANKLPIERFLLSFKEYGDLDNVVLQGEIIGTSIQKNKYKVSDYQFYGFNLIVDGRNWDNSAIKHFLKQYGINTVPLLYDEYVLPDSIKDLVEFSKGNSVLLRGQKREGIVLRNHEKNLSFKCINPDFLLQESEDLE